MTTPTEALAAAIHEDCEADWARRPPGTAITVHSVEVHREASERRLSALSSSGWSLVRTEGLEAARDIAALSDADVRDYEQGACFFCGAGSEVIPGPRGGVTGERARRYIHEATCSYVRLRAALRP